MKNENDKRTTRQQNRCFQACVHYVIKSSVGYYNNKRKQIFERIFTDARLARHRVN